MTENKIEVSEKTLIGILDMHKLLLHEYSKRLAIIEEKVTKLEKDIKKEEPPKEEYYTCNGCGKYEDECICDLFDTEQEESREMSIIEYEDFYDEE